MGIREYFQENPPGEKDLNIHDIVIRKDEKREELPFDPERDITDEDWEKMKEYVNNMHFNNLSEYLWPIAEMKILCPDRFHEPDFDLNWEETLKPALERMMDTALQADENEDKAIDLEAWGGLDGLLTELAAERIIFPDRISEFNLDNRVWQKIKEMLQEDRSSRFFLRFVYRAVGMKIFLPHENLGVDLDDNILKEIKDWNKINPPQRRGNVFAFIKIIFNQQNQKEFNDKLDWQEMRRELEKIRSKKKYFEYGSFISLATAMKILSAHKVQVTNEGLEITMRKPETFRPEKKTKRPERKRF